MSCTGFDKGCTGEIESKRHFKDLSHDVHTGGRRSDCAGESCRFNQQPTGYSATLTSELLISNLVTYKGRLVAWVPVVKYWTVCCFCLLDDNCQAWKPTLNAPP